MAVIDVGLADVEGRVALKEFTNHGRDPALPASGMRSKSLIFERIENALGEAVILARQGEARGELGQARAGVREEREGRRGHLQPG